MGTAGIKRKEMVSDNDFPSGADQEAGGATSYTRGEVVEVTEDMNITSVTTSDERKMGPHSALTSQGTEAKGRGTSTWSSTIPVNLSCGIC